MNKTYKRNGFEFTYVEEYKVVGIENNEYDIVVTNIKDEQMAKDVVNMLTEVMTKYIKLNPITFDELVELKQNLKKTQLFISTTIGDEYDANFEYPENPIQRAREIKDMWLANKALQGYDTPNAEINEDETFITITVNKENKDESARLHLSWE